MRILYVTEGFPYPLTSGHLRHYHLIRELSQRHAVTLASVVDPSYTDAHGAALAPYTERVLVYPSSSRGRPRWEKAANQLRALLRAEPIERAALAMRDALERLRRTAPYDAVIFGGRRTLPALAALEGIPVACDVCDADSVRIRGALRHAGLVRIPILLLDYARVRRAERVLLRRAGQLFFASARDRAALVGAPAPHASVVPNGVDTTYWTRTGRSRGQETIIFTGAMQYLPNTDAALYLIRRVFPRIRRVRPGARLFIVGRNPPARLVRAGRRPGVTVTGRVDDVRPYLEQATVFAAPLRFGAGVQNKVLEALAMELPVVASPLAADGLRTDTGDPPPVEVARTAEEFAARLLAQLERGARDPAPFEAGRVFVERYFLWSRAAETVERALERLVAPGAVSVPASASAHETHTPAPDGAPDARA